MSEIVKSCKIHGELTQKDIRISKRHKRNTIETVCIPCHKISQQKYTEKNKERLKIYYGNYRKEYYEKNKKELNKKSKIYQRKRYKENPERFLRYNKKSYLKNREKCLLRIRKRHLKRKYNISLEEFNQMILDQNNLCAICNKPESRIHNKTNELQYLSVDHCHKTGKIRKLLCDRCNLMLGKYNDSIELFELAVKYLKSFM